MNKEIEKLLIEARELRDKADSIEEKALGIGKLPKIGYDENKFYYTPTDHNFKLFYELGLADTDFEEYRKKLEWFKARKRIVDEIAKERLKSPSHKACRAMYIEIDGDVKSYYCDPEIAVVPKDMLFPRISEAQLQVTLKDDYYTYFGVEKGDFNE